MTTENHLPKWYSVFADVTAEDASEKRSAATFWIHLGGREVSAMRSRIIPAVNQYTKLTLNKLGSAWSKNVQSYIVLARKRGKIQTILCMLRVQLSSRHWNLVISVCAWSGCSQHNPVGHIEQWADPHTDCYTGSAKSLSMVHLLEMLRGAISCSKWRRLRVKRIGFGC